MLINPVAWAWIIGLDGWMQADHSGHVASMRARSGINPMDDPDTAVLAMLLAA